MKCVIFFLLLINQQRIEKNLLYFQTITTIISVVLRYNDNETAFFSNEVLRSMFDCDS